MSFPIRTRSADAGPKLFFRSRNRFFTLLIAAGAWILPAVTGAQTHGHPPGTIIAQSPDPQKLYVASPSIALLPDSTYLASHDWSGPAAEGTVTSIYRSGDKGESWQKVSDVRDMRWATLFYHRGSVYLMGVHRSFGDIHLRRSDDGGSTWTRAVDKRSGILCRGRYHTAPVPVVIHQGRIWRAFEVVESDPKARKEVAPFVLSAPEDADLLNAESWQASRAVSFNKEWLNAGWPLASEGNVVVSPDGGLVNFLRLESHPGKKDSFALKGGARGIPRFEVAAIMELSRDGRSLSFDTASGFVHFAGAESKFVIRYDSVSRRYWVLANKITKIHQETDFNISPHRQRNVVGLFSSADLRNWVEHCRVLRWKEGAIMEKFSPVGFQYLDWQIEGDDLVAVCRTGWFGRRSHDANYITFHRIRNFRSLTMKDSAPDLKE